MPTTKIVYHERYLTDYPTASVERPERVKTIYHELKENGYRFVTPKPADEDDILLVHYPNLVQSEKTDKERYEVALLSAGGAITASELAMVTKPKPRLRPSASIGRWTRTT